MRTLLAGLVPGLPEQALRAIVDRAEGVPLYAVETLRMLIDRGALQAEADGAQYALVGDLPDLDVPQTLQALIAARLDALQPEERALITDAAVLGLSFYVESLRALGSLEVRRGRAAPRCAGQARGARPRRRSPLPGARPVPVRPGRRARGRLPVPGQARPTNEAPRRGALLRGARRGGARRRACQPLPRRLPRHAGRAGGRCARRAGPDRAARGRRPRLRPPLRGCRVGLSRAGARRDQRPRRKSRPSRAGCHGRGGRRPLPRGAATRPQGGGDHGRSRRPPGRAAHAHTRRLGEAAPSMATRPRLPPSSVRSRRWPTSRRRARSRSPSRRSVGR